MRVKVVANELVDTDIEMVSLVRHGANRCPFKVLKADDRPSTLGDKIQSFFSLAKGEVTVAAYFIRKDAADTLAPVLKANGVDVTRLEEADGVIVVKQSDAPPRGFIQLTDALAVAISHPLKEFSEESVVKAYAEGIGLSGFAPSVNLAVRGLADTVWSLLNSGDGAGDREERVAKVDSMLASFRKYVTSLAKMIPEQVFKVESAARAAHTEEADMPKGKLDEAVAGDLEGLVSADEGIVEEPAAKAAEPAAAAPAPVEKADESADPLAVILAKLNSIEAQVGSLSKSVDDQRVITDSLAAQVAESREDLAKADEVRRHTTVVDRGGDMDLALSSLGGSDTRARRPVVKSAEAVWDGLFGDLSTFRPSR